MFMVIFKEKCRELFSEDWVRGEEIWFILWRHTHTHLIRSLSIVYSANIYFSNVTITELKRFLVHIIVT